MDSTNQLEAEYDKSVAHLIAAYRELIGDMHTEHHHSGRHDECLRVECAHHNRILFAAEKQLAARRKRAG
jgi:hypothetical protein